MNNLLQLDKDHIWHPFTPLTGGIEPVLIRSAQGIYLHTDDGREIMDAVSSWWVNLHGHANKDIAQAIAAQALTLEHVIFAGFTHEPAIALAKNLLSILPSNQSKIFYSDNGSTAVEVGLKMAFQYWHNQGIQKRKVIALDGAYHGDTFGSMSVGERGMFTDPFAPFLFDVIHIPFPDAENAEAVVTQFQNLVAGGDVAAFIFEPLVQGAGGMRMYDATILNQLIGEAQHHNVLCIADEVFTGFGRTGKLFASHYLSHAPDIMAVSKGITGGSMALGVTSCSEKIVAAFQSADFMKTFFHGHSYTANPLACAAANASFALLMKDECQEQINTIAREHAAFKSKIANHRNVKVARSLGTILAIEIKTPEGSSYANALRKRIYPFFLERNILLRPLGNTIYVLPPYVIKVEELRKIYDCIELFLDAHVN
ncbi:adenosylmethionine--8-amino-7-oxononanoate transaminase [Chryseolinea lacunae]|uniref:Adenosylmethionine-8-amino-7-oxononanoate aminotransferase n=1 Tax=Chryseolinea lacunae TaxID=2801331 RepID=A0ABS1L2Q5_9BACT|nr:adenosylmethionine--8-amino-7-oxononanoate transaminase [Chryseolinea lacunae]MBL0745924.1 adenosylmethionine--8-amino-7-oxononanoate transaminase [Chryseolinea lacunae]